MLSFEPALIHKAFAHRGQDRRRCLQRTQGIGKTGGKIGIPNLIAASGAQAHGQLCAGAKDLGLCRFWLESINRARTKWRATRLGPGG